MTSPLNNAIYESSPLSEQEMGLSSRVSLEEIRASLSLFGKGLSKKHLKAKPLEQAPTFLSNPWRPFPFSNGQEAYLPASLGVFDSRDDNRKVFRLYFAVQAEQWEAGTFDRPRTDEAVEFWGKQAWMEKMEPLGWIRFFLSRFPLPVLAGNIFFTLETARTAAAMARRFRGLAEDLDWFLPRLKALSEPQGYRGILWSLFFLLLAPAEGSSQMDDMGEIMEVAPRVTLPGSRLRESLEATVSIYHLLEPLAGAAVLPGDGTVEDGVGDFFLETGLGPGGNRAPRLGRMVNGQGLSAFPMELPDALKDLAFVSSFLPAGPGSFLTQDMKKKNVADGTRGTESESTKAAVGEGKAREDGEQEERRLHYPEWDFLVSGYRRDWVTLYQLRAKEGTTGATERLLQGWDDLVREVCRQFRMLRYQERAWRKRLEWGQEIDLEAAVRREVDRRCGIAPSEKVYMEKRRKGREVSALFLLDLSASTSSKIEEGSHKGETVLQVLLSSVAIMARALEQLDDRYGIFGFSGYGRERVEYLRIKAFNEPLGNAAWQRIGGLKPRMSTRMGAAVRHAHHILKAEPSSLKLMLLLSDGYPQDHDYGEDRTDREYGLQDTAQALREAEADRIIPFCITVDAAGHDYLRRMCSPRGYMVLKGVQDLPRQLPKVYVRLRGF